MSSFMSDAEAPLRIIMLRFFSHLSRAFELALTFHFGAGLADSLSPHY
jgi:hypothetical protein